MTSMTNRTQLLINLILHSLSYGAYLNGEAGWTDESRR